MRFYEFSESWQEPSWVGAAAGKKDTKTKNAVPNWSDRDEVARMPREKFKNLDPFRDKGRSKVAQADREFNYDPQWKNDFVDPKFRLNIGQWSKPGAEDVNNDRGKKVRESGGHCPYAKALELVLPEYRSKLEYFENAAHKSGYSTIYNVSSNGSFVSGKLITDSGVLVELVFGKGPKSRSEIRLPGIANGNSFPNFKTETLNIKNKILDSLSSIYKLEDKGSWARVATRFNNVEDGMNSVLNIVHVIDNLGPEFEEVAAAAQESGQHSSTNPSDYYDMLARNIVTSWVTKQPSMLARQAMGKGYDEKDKLIVIGFTKGGQEQRANKRPYREHAVPCFTINKTCIQILDEIGSNFLKYTENNPSFKDTAEGGRKIGQFVKIIRRVVARLLCIVYTSDEESRYLDSKEGLNTQMTMPSGWNWKTAMSDDKMLLYRFTVAQMPVYQIKTLKRIAENF